MGNVNGKESRSRSNSTTETRRRSNTTPSRSNKRNSEPERLVVDPNEMVDGGYLAPHGVYSGPHSYKYKIVRQLIIERRLAPFFKGLSDFDESWSDREILAAVRGIPLKKEADEDEDKEPDNQQKTEKELDSDSKTSNQSQDQDQDHESDIDEDMRKIYQMKADAETQHVELISSPTPSASPAASESAAASPQPEARQRSFTTTDHTNQLPEVMVYKGAVECPICFLFYPKHLNSTRCCIQPICTECFVQIKRADPHPPPHGNSGSSASTPLEDDTTSQEQEPSQQSELISEPACCPYCTAPDFGIVYIPPSFRSGIGAHKYYNKPLEQVQKQSERRERKGSLPPSASEVVTTDQIRPDWVKQLHSARQHRARRSAAANALHATAFLSADEAARSSASSSTSSKRHHRFRGLKREKQRQGLEDMMLVEAIRLSMHDEEVRRKKEKEDKKGKGKTKVSRENGNGSVGVGAESGAASGSQ